MRTDEGHLDRMRELRDAGPTYPISVISNFATITLLEYMGEDNESVIAGPPGGDG
jgi:phenolic acid decarboxylase